MRLLFITVLISYTPTCPQAFLKARLDTDIWLQLPPGITFKDKDGNISASFGAVDQYHGHGCSSSELGSGVVLAINDKESVDVSMDVLNTIMDDDDKDSVDASLNDIADESDNSLTDDHELAFLYMMDIPDLQPGQTSGEGVEESKTGDCSDSDDVVKVVRNTFATPTEAALIRSGAVTAEQLRMCAQEHLNRRSLAEPAPVRSEQPDHDCRTAGCRRQAPGPFPPSVCGIRELHCCVHCYDTNGARHSRECDVYTTDSTTVSSQEGEGLQVLDTHLEHIYTYERDGSECKPGGASAVHPDSDSETAIDDNDGSDAQQPSTSPSGGVPATRMYGGFGPEPEGGNPNDVFIDNGEDDDDEVFIDNDEADDDEVDPIALTVGLGPPPDDDDDVFIDDGDGDGIVDPAIAADATPTAGSSAASSSSSPSCRPT